jgi:hypothetical protein
MIKKMTFGLILSFLMISCSKHDDDVNSLSGTFTETLPIHGRSQLKFISRNQVIKKEKGSSIEDKFDYEIVDNIIIMTPIWDNSTTTKFQFELINSSKFHIQNLYPDIPENPITYMTFEKSN